MKLPIVPPDPTHPDMSPEAIDRRLRDLAQIYRLGMSLRGAKWLGPVNAPVESESCPGVGRESGIPLPCDPQL